MHTRSPIPLVLAIAWLVASHAAALPDVEWELHRSADGAHPDGHEQAVLWLMNRARQNPTGEGLLLATDPHPDISGGRGFFGVDVALLEQEFIGLPPTPPAAFDRRLHQAAKEVRGIYKDD